MSSERELKHWHLVVLAIIIGIALIYRVYQSVWPKATVEIGGATRRVLVADNYQRRYQGWSNRDSMGRWGGMLFLFPDRGDHPLVMRAMQFPLDIIWLDGNTVVGLAERALPEAGRREEDLTVYRAGAPSDAVLELPAGFVARQGVKIGDRVKVED
ncbi:MAG: DUF192 domain-containing protein [Candidatus Magasanikbacteria bacterium]|nr:DUF192 domain-containing protein [Candidatus Magasanikbacteria bacterium]